jgi:hypothetical protein
LTVLATAAGVALIALAVRDVFGTLFHPHGPVIAGLEGAVVVDARLRIESTAPAPPWPSA